MRIIGGLVIIAFGLQLIGLLKISALYKDTRFFSDDKPRGMFGSAALGMAFAAGWTPCIGPILGGIIGLAATSGGWRSGLVLSAFYSAGLAVPFLLTGLGINQFLSFYKNFRKHLHKVEVVSGVVLILVGLLVMSGQSTLLASSKFMALDSECGRFAESLVQDRRAASQSDRNRQTQTSNWCPTSSFKHSRASRFVSKNFRARSCC